MDNYTIQLERLKRHYEQSLKHYDIISFLDLSHSLRIFTEMKEEIDKVIKDPIFKKPGFRKGLKKIIDSEEYVFIYLPGGVTTSAVATKEIDIRELCSAPTDSEQFTNGTLIKYELNGDLTIAHFLMTKRCLAQKEVEILNREISNMPIEKVFFSRYMESPAVYFKFGNLQPTFIANEELIKRIANEYKGSHAGKNDSKLEVYNKFSEPVSLLMKYNCAKIPLPYFILLHLARNIIESMENVI